MSSVVKWSERECPYRFAYPVALQQGSQPAATHSYDVEYQMGILLVCFWAPKGSTGLIAGVPSQQSGLSQLETVAAVYRCQLDSRDRLQSIKSSKFQSESFRGHSMFKFDDIIYHPMLPASVKVEACITDVVEPPDKPDKVSFTVKVTVVSTVLHPPNVPDCRQTVLGIQLLPPPASLQRQSYEPKYKAPPRSETFAAKTTHSAAGTNTQQDTTSTSKTLSSQLAISKNTVFSIGGNKTWGHSHLEGFSTTLSLAVEEGHTVTVVRHVAFMFQFLLAQSEKQVWTREPASSAGGARSVAGARPSRCPLCLGAATWETRNVLSCLRAVLDVPSHGREPCK